MSPEATVQSTGNATRDPSVRRAAWILLLLVLLAYLPVILRAGFIWDDDEYLTSNALVQHANGLADIWLHPQKSPQYYPMVFTTFWVEHQLWGLHSFGYHLVNLLLHAASALLVWRILARLNFNGAWLAAALWAVHPVMVESVAWITERKNVLSALFYLAALLVYLRFTDRDLQKSTPRWYLYAAALALFALALLSKSVACSFPVAVLILTWYHRGRLRWRDLALTLPFFLLGAAAGLNTAILERIHVGATGSDWAFSPADRVLIAGRALWFYLAHLCLPFQQIFVYPRWALDAGAWWQWLFPASAALAVLALAVAAARRQSARGPLAAILFFVITIFPALGFTNIYPMRFTFVADHYQYLASLGILVLIAAGLTRLGQSLAPRTRPIAGAILLLALATLTALQCRVYESATTLWTDTLSKNPDAWLADDNLAVIDIRQGNFDAAWSELQHSLQLKPTSHVEVYRSLGEWYYTQGRTAEAEPPLQEALSQEGSDTLKGFAANMLGAIAVSRKDYPAAADWFRASTRYMPRYAAPWINLQHVEKLLGHPAEEQAAAAKAAQLQESP